MPAPASARPDPREALERFFGFQDFRHAQADVVGAVLEGRDALVVMPTGGGKSLCYQLPALIQDGVAIVVSPLIALMKDQVDALQARGIAATMINSAIGPAEQRERIGGMARGEFKLVYIAPERFRSESFVAALARARLSFVAVDEAHCLSQWGHDFRPDYLRVGEALQRLGQPQVAAFTATATPEVREDILKHLHLRSPAQFVTGFSRPNLQLSVRQVSGEAEKYSRLQKIVERHTTGIVYCASRKRVEEVSETMSAAGISVVAYHGGMDDAAREEAQNAFLRREKNVAVATNAFGMGIDRADIRFVVHFEVPGSIEAYYQEAGRAGRDGGDAVCELFFNFADTRIQEFFIDGNNPRRSLILDTYEMLRQVADAQGEVAMGIQDLAERMGSGTNSMAVGTALSILHRQNFIERHDIPGKRVRGTRVVDPKKPTSALALDTAALEEKERRDRAKLKGMVDFAYARRCRQEWILHYFGETGASICGTCDCCSDGTRGKVREGAAEEEVVVRKALSGVARMSRRSDGGWTGRYGRGRIIQMLLGSRAKEILEAGLDQLSTYGLLKQEGNTYVTALFRELEQEGLIKVESGEYPLVTLTPRGEEVMRGERRCLLAWPRREELAPPRRGRGGRVLDGPVAWPLNPEDEPLFEALKVKRNEMADATGAPAYTVFANLTLRALASARPSSASEAEALPGIGPYKARRYLPDLLEIIRRFPG
jgi:ATP-dependent DNA helicase RecQ